MSAAENKQLIKAIFEELGKGNSRPYFDALADDFSFTIMGGTAWKRTFAGKAAVVRDLFRPLTAQYADRYTMTTTNIVAEGDVVIVESRGCVTTKRGDPYSNLYCLVFEVRDGRLQACREYADSALVERVLDPPPVARLPEALGAG